ncbi:MAG: hypothetical protein K8H88_08410 [Sandaracinaceae bacterium]|nr:hypothetical protein [Sandaracinaceae bacterium]
MGAAEKVHLDERDARIVQIDELLVVDWQGPVRVDAVVKVGDAIRKSGSEHPSGVALLMIVREACGVPEPRARQQIKTTIGEVERHIRAHATVIEGAGILASTVRTTINAMRVVIRHRYAERIFADVPAAIDWLRGELGGGVAWTTQGVRRAIGGPNRSG